MFQDFLLVQLRYGRSNGNISLRRFTFSVSVLIYFWQKRKNKKVFLHTLSCIQACVMEYSSSKPLSLQVYKTSAEFKAFRLNRTEQCRLKCTQTFISREERNFHKDFKTSRTKVNQFLRRFSVQDPGVLGGPVTPIPWSTTTTPRTVSASFGRRASESPSASVQHTSVWSLPESLARTKLLQKRRQTFGGGSAHYPAISRAFMGRNSVVGVMSTRECDFHDHLSSVMESYKTWGSNDQHDSQSPVQQQEERTVCPETDKSSFQERGKTVSSPGEGGNIKNSGSEPVQNEALKVDKDDTDLMANNCNGLTVKEELQPSIKTANSGRLRRYSKPTTSMMGGLNGLNNRLQSLSVVSSNNLLKEKEWSHDKGEGSSGVRSDQHLSESGKSDRKVSIMQPSTRVSVLKTPPSSDIQPSPNMTADTETRQPILLQYAKECPAGEPVSLHQNSTAFNKYRETAVAFANFQQDLESVGESALQGKVSSFLQEQNDFNRRFPLKHHEVKSLGCVRPDLLQTQRAQAESKIRSKGMITEVLEKLGMADIETDVAEKKQLFPPVK